MALTGVLAGAGGIALTEILHLVQHLAFGYTDSTFLVGVEHASPTRRVLALGGGGLVVGAGWWALARYGRPLVGIPAAMSDPNPRLDRPETAAEAMLQIVAVGSGASLGREGAPRLLGAAAAQWLTRRLGIPAERRRVLIACGAGAGLAAVYNVPVGGTLFVLEVLLLTATPRVVLAAAAACGIATVVAWSMLGRNTAYLVPVIRPDPGLLVWSALIGPLCAAAGLGFLRLTGAAARRPPSGRRLPVALIAVFAGLGALSVALPQLPGNGRGPAQLAVDGTLAVGLTATLLVLKPLVTAGFLAAGARGRLLTPAVATGALLGALAGAGWSAWWPGSQPAGYAVVGAAGVLAVTQRAPLTAVALVVEFTHPGPAAIAPLVVAVAGATLTARWSNRAGPGRKRRRG